MPAPRDAGKETILYRLYDQLDRLEELLEDMVEFEVRSAEEIEQKITTLNNQIDALEDDSE